MPNQSIQIFSLYHKAKTPRENHSRKELRTTKYFRTILLEARSPFTLRFPWALVSSLRAVALRDLTYAFHPTGVYV